MFSKVRFYKILRVIFAATLLVAGSVATQPATPADAKQLWQLIDYVAVDYGGAVANGAVVSDAEYAEMLDFTENAGKQVQLLPAHAGRTGISAAIDELRAAVVRKADAAEVAQLAHHANGLLLLSYPIPVAPKSIPDLGRGRTLYLAQCASCHGASGGGDGPMAASLEPPPIAFTDAERARSRSVMALFQIISQGVAGTSMASFETLPEDDRWALAFYVGSIAYDTDMRQRGDQLWKASGGAVKGHFPDLAAVTTITEALAAQTLPKDTARDITAYLRSHPGVVDAGKHSGVPLARQRLQESLAALREGDKPTATRLALSAYLDGFEPIEPIVGARDKSLLVAVEGAMLNYRSMIVSGSAEQAQAAADELTRLFSRVEVLMNDAKADPTTTFLGALAILLREGVEALLIVIGMIALLKKAGRPDALRPVHVGWISALFAGGLTWVVATFFIEISGASREVTEGLGSVLAAVVLLSVGLWMHQKSSAGRWQDYLSGKLSAAMTRKSAGALFALSFIAVYREVFETVLFYSALAAEGNGNALAAGFLTALILLALIAFGLLRTSARMPIGKFFSFTSILVAVLAIVLIGKGVSALQEAGWISANLVNGPRVDWLGLYPTLETVAAQVVVAMAAFGGFGFNWLTARRHSKE
ncbi:iron permease [Duganella sp. Leaf126]|uniref:cytochrome c/FTR1 family iron permease n=1 Tax=Duganella sp. Leaf126 TaxID=1736266 RepID=UPI0006F2FC29|nr:cytochrome c/FTR1 family iron permease [Duganella sp. Leaf126]KQQ44665.1 iron permease [Duganella sp. Leaf126]